MRHECSRLSEVLKSFVSIFLKICPEIFEQEHEVSNNAELVFIYVDVFFYSMLRKRYKYNIALAAFAFKPLMSMFFGLLIFFTETKENIRTITCCIMVFDNVPQENIKKHMQYTACACFHLELIKVNCRIWLVTPYCSWNIIPRLCG